MEKKCVLLVGIVGSRVGNIVQNLLLVQTISLRNWNQPFWPKRALCVNIHRHAFATALLDRQLTSDAQRVTKLRLSRSKLAKKFSDGPCFETTPQQCVQRFTPRAQLDHIFALLEIGPCRHELHAYLGLRRLQNLLQLRLTDALHLNQRLLGRVTD